MSLLSRRAAVCWSTLALILAACSGPSHRTPSAGPSAPPVVTPPAVTTSPAGTASPTPPARPASTPRIVMVVEENHPFDDIIGSPDAPTINRLAREGTLLTSYHAITHPSLPNYLAMLAGTTGGVRNDCTACSLSAPNLVDQLESAGISWAAYFPGLPGTCSTVAKAGEYAKKHNPFLYFPSVRDDPSRCSHVVPFDGFATDAAAGRLPRFVFISPDLEHDMHDGSVRTADRWLTSLYDQLRRSPAWREDTRLVVVFDEGRRGDNHVTAVVAGPQVPSQTDSAPYTHYSLLRSIEAAFGLPYLDHAAEATPIPALAHR